MISKWSVCKYLLHFFVLFFLSSSKVTNPNLSGHCWEGEGGFDPLPVKLLGRGAGRNCAGKWMRECSLRKMNPILLPPSTHPDF